MLRRRWWRQVARTPLKMQCRWQKNRLTRERRSRSSRDWWSSRTSIIGRESNADPSTRARDWLPGDDLRRFASGVVLSSLTYLPTRFFVGLKPLRMTMGFRTLLADPETRHAASQRADRRLP